MVILVLVDPIFQESNPSRIARGTCILQKLKLVRSHFDKLFFTISMLYYATSCVISRVLNRKHKKLLKREKRREVCYFSLLTKSCKRNKLYKTTSCHLLNLIWVNFFLIYRESFLSFIIIIIIIIFRFSRVQRLCSVSLSLPLSTTCFDRSDRSGSRRWEFRWQAEVYSEISAHSIANGDWLLKRKKITHLYIYSFF